MKSWISKIVFAGVLMALLFTVGGGASELRGVDFGALDDFLRPRIRAAEALFVLFAVPALGTAAFFFASEKGNSNARFGVLILCGVAAIVTPVLWAATRLPRKAAVKPKGVCEKCGYNLTGNASGVCPECGTKVGNTA
jgi:hypothetical protein